MDEATVVSFLVGKLNFAQKHFEKALFQVERIDEASLAVGWNDDYFCNVLLLEDDKIGIGFDLQTNPQVSADASIVLCQAVGAGYVDIMEPHYQSLDGEIYFGDEAYTAFDKDKQKLGEE